MNQTDTDRQIERVVERGIGIVKAAFPEGQAFVDPHALGTTFVKFKERVEDLSSNGRAQRICQLGAGLVARLVSAPDAYDVMLANRKETAREGAERVSGLHRGAELLDLLLAADQRVRHGGLVAFYDFWPFGLQEFPNPAPLSGLAQIDDLDGEPRAFAVINAFVPVCEFLYLRVARGVRKLELFADGKTMADGLSLGNVLSASEQRAGYAARILDLDAAWIRNAVAHTHYAYLPDADALELWGRAGPRRAFPVAVLEERLTGLLDFALETANATLVHYIQTSVIQRGEFDVAMLDVLPTMLGIDDEDTRSERGERFVAKLEEEFGPLVRELDGAQPSGAGAKSTA